ncbi:MAG: tyrosine-protein phosphatase [Kiloniellales bacterium]|nr:tyrosine-protein phosphatase [Kiloniellales bacterium]
MTPKSAISSLSLGLQAVLVLLLVAACTTPPDHPQRVSMSGTLNFRDAGGYDTVDGKRVKQGVLFRSDHLAELNTADLDIVSDLGVRTVFDLRHDYERSAYPSRLPSEGAVEVVEVPVYYPPLDRRESRRKILAGEVENGHFQELMIEANRAFALDFNDQWAGLIRRLAAPGARPAVIHCADGKDRTGFAVAVVLSAVGVPRETVYEDFLLSNVFLERRTRLYAFLASFGSLFRVPRSEVRPLLEVRRAYLEAAFAAIDERYGSFDAYLRDGLDLDEATLARLRTVLTE